MDLTSHSIAQEEKGTPFVFLAAILAAVGGLLFGYDTGVISGALIFIRQKFALSVFHEELVVSVALVGAACASLAGGRLADYFGRRATLLATSIIFMTGAALCALAPSVGALIAGRIVVGVGIGLACSAVPVYISEISPAPARGWMVSLIQLAITLGILGSYLVDYGFSSAGGWRWMLGLAFIPGLLLGLGMIFMPETPRWLMERGREEDARKVLKKIRGDANIEAEIEDIGQTLLLAKERGRWADLLAPSVRPALVIGLGIAFFQQVTGINTVIYYAPTIIQSAGIPSASGAILATAGIGLVNVLMTVVAMWLMDRVGRRPLLLIGTAGMIVSLGGLGLFFHLPSHAGASAALAVALLMAYVASFAVSLGPIFWLLIAEIYPLRIRGLAGGTAAGVNWACNFLVSLTFLSLIQAIGPGNAFWLYGALAVASWIFSYYLVPETKGRTLEQIEAAWRERLAQPAA
ncbi:MAG TPA: sugar porter family MFS transporter [Elusimicrobiota bacterium]|nr:sugar porter family MFS transporter [Elusimicrobiota bacterium]